MPNFAKFLTAGILIAAGVSAQARTDGWDVDPLGSHASPLVQFAYWDRFTQTQVGATTNYTFNGVSDITSTLTGLSLSQNSAHALGVQGSGLLAVSDGTGDAYYSSTFAQNWLLSATSSINIMEISFQIKTANVDAQNLSQYYIPTLNGVKAGTFYGGVAAGDAPFSGTFANYVIEYRWSNLNLNAGDQFQIAFSMAGGSSGAFTRKPVDFVSVDVTSVPEPGTAMLVGVAALGLTALRRRRASV